MKIFSHSDPAYQAFVRRLNRRAIPEAGVRDLVGDLPDSELVSLRLQDNGYDRRLMRHGPDAAPGEFRRGDKRA